jgi:hypothetical protein
VKLPAVTRGAVLLPKREQILGGEVLRNIRPGKYVKVIRTERITGNHKTKIVAKPLAIGLDLLGAKRHPTSRVIWRMEHIMQLSQ